MTLRQIASSQPYALTRLLNEAPKVLPALLFLQPDLGNSFLPQNIEPSPAIQLVQDFYRSKFSVANQKNRSSFRDQLANVGQQSQLLPGSTMSSDVFDPSPGNRNAALPIGQAHDQQLMPKTDFRAIHNQTNLSDTPKLGFQPLPGNRLIPRSHSNGRIIQQSAQSPRHTRQFCFSRNLASYFTHTHRTTQVNSDDQPYKPSNLGDPLSWTQFHYSHFPGIIKVVDRHWITPFLRWLRKTNFSGESLPINYSLVKLSGD